MQWETIVVFIISYIVSVFCAERSLVICSLVVQVQALRASVNAAVCF